MSVDGPLGPLSEASWSSRRASPSRSSASSQEYGIVQPSASDGRDALRRDRPRDRPRRGRARALRRRRAQPARLPHLRRPRGGAARADRRAVAALAQPGPPARGGREPREPRRHLRPPQAPAAGARPAPPDRRVAPRRAPMPRVDRRGVIAAAGGARLGSGLRPVPPAALVAAGACGSRTSRAGRRGARWTHGARDRDGQPASAPTTAAGAVEPGTTLRLGRSRSRERRSSASCARRARDRRSSPTGDGDRA